MGPHIKKRRRNSPYSGADAVTSLLDTFVTKQAEAKQRKASPSTKTRSAATTATVSTTRSVVMTPQAMQAMMICHERFLQILAAELAVGAEEDPSAKSAATPKTTASGLTVVQPTNVLSAIEQLGWEELVPPVEVSSKKAKQGRRRPAASSSVPRVAGVRKRKGKKKREWSADELAAQERLIAGSKKRLDAAALVPDEG
jgi:hypothetical protein